MRLISSSFPFRAFFLLSIISIALTLSAQETKTAVPAKSEVKPQFFKPGDNEFGIWGGFSAGSPTIIGVTTDRKLFLNNINWSRVILAGRTVAWKYTMDAVPVALITQPAEVVGPPFVPTVTSKSARTIYGAGINPLGMQLNFANTHKVQPFIQANGGLLYFTEQVPVIGSSQFNFAFSFGGGLQVFARDNKTVTVGYRFHHLSNNETALRNPGSDANMFYLGFSWLPRKH